MRAATLALLVALAGSCKTPEPPDSFGINVSITIDPASRAGLAQVLFTAAGAEDYAAGVPASAFPDGTGKIHYVPGAHSGSLIIGATAQDGAGATLGAGNTGTITIVDGHAVAASITITPSGSSMGDGGVDGGNGKNLGEMCGLDTECGSGHCVDGVCCGVASCGQCQNCGAAGSCVAVTGKDDNSGDMTCSGQKSCDGSGMCKDRWVLAKMITGYSWGNGGQTAGVGGLVYLQGESPQTPPATPTYTYDPATGNLVMQNGNTDICFCGASSYMFPAGGKVCEFGNDASCMDSTAPPPRSWSAPISGYVFHNGGAWVGIGTKIYGNGGNSHDKTLSIYDTVANSWSSGPDAPFGLTGAAGGITGTKFLIMGQTPVNTEVMLQFDTSNNMWTQLGNPPQGIYDQFLPEFRGKLWGKSGQSLRTYDIATDTWDPAAIPLPTGLANNASRIAVAGTPPQLFVIGDDATSTVNIFLYNL